MMKKIQYKRSIMALAILTLLVGCTEDTLYPVAGFTTFEYVPGLKFNLDASESFSQVPVKKLRYRWDFIANNETWDTPWLDNPIYAACLPNVPDISYIQHIGLQVKDTIGNISEIYKRIRESRILDNSLFHTSFYDGKDRETINYGKLDQIWLLENLYAKTENGIVNTPDSTVGSYFTWEKANESYSNDIHLPSLEDWQSLIEAYNGPGLAGFNMATQLDHSIKLTYSGYYYENQLHDNNMCGYYWTSTPANDNLAYAIKITFGKDEVEIIELPKEYLLSARLFRKYGE
ncbi:MAG: hypothetical protein JW798_07685 [Prolixibacteraceae bacterium]|nr:hypothetical protein [Prolixibacteraceae bacterium]